MKNYSHLILLILISCTGNDFEAEINFYHQIKAFTNQIAKTWVPEDTNGIILNGEDITDRYRGFSLTIDKNLNYSTLNGGMLWASEGALEVTATIQNPDFTKLIRDDQLILEIIDLTGESNNQKGKMTLKFTIFLPQGSEDPSDGVEGSPIIVDPEDEYTMRLKSL